MNNTPLISLKDITVTLAGRIALDRVNWALLPGEHWAVTGANGAGKSTFIKVLRGEIRPDQNTDGLCIWNFSGTPETSALAVRPLARIVSAEMHRIYARRAWRITGHELVLSGFSDAFLASPEEENSSPCYDAVVAIARTLGADALLPMEIATCSQGQLRLLLLARALVTKPRLLLLDEPFDGLDSRARNAIDEAVAHAAEHASVICSAHREADLPACLTHSVCLERGRVVYCGLRAASPRMQQDISLPEGGVPATPVTQPKKNAKSPTVPYAVELENADIYVNRVKVLHGITWQVPTGENWRISGPNGSGKSTLIRLLAGLEHVAVGGIYRRFGVKHPSLTAVQKDSGYLSDQLHALYTYELTGLELVCTGFDGSIGLWRDIRPKERKLAEQWLAALGLESLASTSVSSLSSGQARRFFLARALVAAPRLLLLDEPCSGLDAVSRAQFFETLSLALAKGVQCLYVSHHTDDIPSGITHELCFDEGRVVYSGPLRGGV